MSAGKRAGLAVFLAASGLLVFLLPFSLMLLPNPAPMRVSDLSSAPTGVYLRASGAEYRVFPFGAEQSSFPGASGSAARDSVVLVKYRNLSDLAGYALHSFPSRSEVPVRRVVHASEHVLELRPKPLPAGRYYVTTTREGMWGGTDYVYFRVE
ncbi:MAG TPA: hypothetical protein VGK50_09030 [Coriobacteriia bacterium]|jgi:hypothetical protein